MVILPKIPRPQNREEARIDSPAGQASILGPSVAPSPGWHHVILDKRAVAVAYCPKCLKRGYLNDHEISADGTVTPSVECPHAPCTFHDHVKLENWEP